MIFKGVLTALITPFFRGGIDVPSLEKLLDKQIEAAIDAVVVGGSTGEGSLLSENDYYELISHSVKYSSKNIPIIAGFTATSTIDATLKTKKLCDLGVDGIMATMPHYVKPEQEGIFQHFRAINDISKVPVMVYIHPPRTGCDMSDDTLLRLARLNRIVAVKDASDDIEKPLRILPHLNKEFNFFTGNDTSVLSYSANGGSGVVSVLSNIAPKLCKKLSSLWHSGNVQDALILQQKLMPLISSIFNESNPIGVKYAASKLDLCSNDIKLPMISANSDTMKKIDKELSKLMGLKNV
ncbi:4-hydroxy-tetrahydrodipicolinate synthase [Rickettsiaceae bacterium]|nr:4-hydroxy-tetrahydrodipicolinate synthase [Rickettsiaceae bacterium]